MGELAVIVGGARSGKSAFALRWAQPRGDRRVFIATAQCLDDEMQARAALHRQQRATNFRTLEAPFGLEESVLGLLDTDVIVIDCLTLWLSNLLLLGQSDALIETRCSKLASVLRAAPFASIVVSNEVGMGIVPDNALARRFRDLSGRAHQVLAAASDELYLAAIGTVMRLRPAPLELVAP